MEKQEDGWMTVLEKNGLGPVVAILENYGIDSETDLFQQVGFSRDEALVCKETRALVWICATCCRQTVMDLKCHLLSSKRHGFRNRLKCHLL
jgi:hypothetical protein